MSKLHELSKKCSIGAMCHPPKQCPAYSQNVSVVIRQATMANAVIQTSKAIVEVMEVDHEGNTRVVVDDPIKIFMMLMNRTVIATCMIPSLLSQRCIS